ncbi:MAG: ECF-type sigma factor [Woeseiaceae bacterium]|nr:ECF-type sigma factor [Woeseiaceae bacterium]
MEKRADNLTGLLHRAADGDSEAHDDLFAHIYPTLRQLARRQLGAHRKGTLCTTDLVNEASLRLFGSDKLARLDGRNHLFATAARAMRHILVDYARQKSAQKRGGDWHRLSLDEGQLSAATLPEQILVLEDALERLQGVDERGYQVVELKFFGGLTIEEIAEYLGVSDMTVKRDWRRSRAFLYAELESP